MPGLTLSYPRDTVLADWLRAAAGFAVTAGPLMALPMAWPLQMVLGAMAAVFAVFGVQTWLRQRLRIELDEDGFEARPRYGRVSWENLRGVSLAYFSTRRDRANGWFELKLGTPAGNMRVDSRMTGFEGLAAAAVQAAHRRGLAMSATSMANCRELGIGGFEQEGA